MGECSNSSPTSTPNSGATGVDPFERQRTNVIIAAHFPPARHHAARHRILLDYDVRATGARRHNSTLPMRFLKRRHCKDAPAGTLGNTHLVSVLARQKPPAGTPANSGSRCHVIQFFIDRAYQHLLLQAPDSARRLALFLQPIQHADVVEIPAPPCPPHRLHRLPHCHLLVGNSGKLSFEKRLHEMRRAPAASRSATRSAFLPVQ